MKKIKSDEQLRELQKEEIDKERIQMEDAIGFSNFVNFLSQTVSFHFLKLRTGDNFSTIIFSEKINRWPQYATRCHLHNETIRGTDSAQMRCLQENDTQNISKVSR